MHTNLLLYIKAATELKLPFQYRHEHDGVEVYLAGKKYFFRVLATPFNDAASQNMTLNKIHVNRLLASSGFPVPHADCIYREDGTTESPWVIPTSIRYPVVVKPALEHGLGKDVLCNVQNEATLLEYLKEHKDRYRLLALEKFEEGLISYRIVVFFGKVIGVVQREPAAVTGDGEHTISQLIAIENVRRLEFKLVTISDLKVDKECLIKLRKMNISLAYVPKSGEKITLHYTCNSSRGGSAISLGNTICKENADLACRAAKLLNVNLVGFDIICEDIMRPIQSSRGFFIEANSDLDFTINEVPMAGTAVPVAKIILKRLIRQHPWAYAWAYLKPMNINVPLILRSIVLLALVSSAGKLLHFYSKYMHHV